MKNYLFKISIFLVPLLAVAIFLEVYIRNKPNDYSYKNEYLTNIHSIVPNKLDDHATGAISGRQKNLSIRHGYRRRGYYGMIPGFTVPQYLSCILPFGRDPANATNGTIKI